MIRYAFGYSSNGWLELQWYMFAILVMFGASYTFKRNEHVRVEIFYLFLSEARPASGLDLIGTPVLPDPGLPAPQLSVLAIFHASLFPLAKGRVNAGGLARWPIHNSWWPAGFRDGWRLQGRGPK